MRELNASEFFTLQQTQRKSLLDDLLTDEYFLDDVNVAATAVVDTILNGNKLLVCGNGGSACEAQHFVGELVGRFSQERRSLPAIALNADGGLLTCIGNDYGFDQVFSRQLEGLYQKGDLLVVLSTSGNSLNVLRAVEKSKELGVDSVALLGKDGSVVKNAAWCSIVVPSNKTDQIQEVHLFVIHYFCHLIDYYLKNAI